MYIFRPICFNVVKGPLKKILSCRMATRSVIIDDNLSEVKIEKLNDRSLLYTGGRDAFEFLQMYSTNDLQCLLKDKQSVYTTFLNTRGRVIHDVFIYNKSLKEKSFLIESDQHSSRALYIHLAIHRKLKDVILVPRDDKYSVWVIFDPNILQKPPSQMFNHGVYETSDLSFLEEVDFGDEVMVCYDPRIISIGIRIVAPTGLDIYNLVRQHGFKAIKANPGEFKLFRYKLGICEGLNEVLYGKNYPSELNCDLLNGMSNKKNYYFGREAVNVMDTNVEQRVVPIKIMSDKAISFPINTPLMDLERRKKKPIGYLRGLQGVHGIALMQVTKRNCEREVRIGNILAQCTKPFWWSEINQYDISAKQNICKA
ncbi:hypothetical protein O3M35_000247 [Rhynocoris fuscipes]|uniref:CAF17 C-terminal domain-containing protein n=1 Tax=Rhynocoris fuscipes TaxID=488301 RepID=A0AAW1DNR6_9HEMI